MQKLGTARSTSLFATAALVALLAILFAGRAGGASAAPEASKAVVRTVSNKTLDTTVLVNRRGMTLYTLSAETRGRFICTTKFCLSLWTPLVVAHGTKPTGAQLLATIRRPDNGTTQVTYRGRPLYTFNQDTKPGDVKGNGFKDVGIWHPASPTASKATPPPTGGYGGLYG
jgi:predicted lipoprotein with Yx(FWY)xxD motif